MKNVLKGIVIGFASIMPGISGGTMAVSMGIYDKLIYAMNHLFSEFKKKSFISYAHSFRNGHCNCGKLFWSGIFI